MILLSKNRQGLHDKIAKTRVISPYAADEERFSPLKVLAGLFGATTLGVVALVYFMLFSVGPIKMFAQVLATGGVGIGDVSGSLYQGFTLKRYVLQARQWRLALKAFSLD